MHLLIIRHGQCLGQCDPTYSSDPDSPLSPHGEHQAHQLAQRLCGEQLTHILSSPLVRSLLTASIIADVIGHQRIDVWPELREGWNDRHRGLGRTVLQRRFPRAVLPSSMTEEGWAHGGDTNYDVFFVRAQGVLCAIKQQFGADDRIAIVTHGGFAKYLLHAILHIMPTTPQWFELANCSLSCVRLVPEPAKERRNWPLYPPVEAEVLSINDVRHLSG